MTDQPEKVGHTAEPWTWRDTPGAGLEIFAVLPAGFQICGTAKEWDGKTSVMTWGLPDRTTVQIGYERWVQFSTGTWNEMQKANARLIAAAPELLSIARRWAALDGGAWHQARHSREKAELLADTNAAIAKATGT